MRKFHRVFSNTESKYIGFLCRVVNLLEDVQEDAECSDIYVTLDELYRYRVVIEPVDCKYSIRESIDIFSEQHRVDNISISDTGHGYISFTNLYDFIIDKYRETLHSYIQQFISKTINTSHEYFLAVLFNGNCLILEGEKNRVTIPRIYNCLSAHTHPSNIPYPSPRDIDEIIEIFINRGIGHIIVAKLGSLVIYRTKPLTDAELEIVIDLRSRNPSEVVKELNKLSVVRVKFF